MRFSTPGPPLGILVKSSLPSCFWSAKRKGQWSVETTGKRAVCERLPERRLVVSSRAAAE